MINDASSSEYIAWFIVLGIEAVTMVTLNALTIIIYLKEPRLRKRSMYLVISLAVADIFNACSVIFWIFSLANGCNFWTIKFLNSVEIYVVLVASFNYFPAVSITNLAVISLERMHATFRPIKHRLIEKNIFGAAVAAVWLITGLFTAIFLSQFLLGDISWDHVYSAYFSFLLCVSFIIFVSYTSIAIKFYCGTHPQHHGAIIRERKLTKTLFLVTVVSLTLLLPLLIVDFLFFVYSGGSYDTISHQKCSHLQYTLIFLFFANSFINPLLYALKIPEFKRALLSLSRCRSHSQRVRVFPLNNM
ncbi:adenosine receptor A3-like [Montipora foliosa]|uniref:adenosine receptor A3-like n=1 Tax=Montipora foliosa TaxID=591990 RepID=UPI0035F1D814